MDYKQLYDKYYSRMSKEGMLKSFVCALTAGFAVGGVIALITWIVDFTAGLWLALGALLAVTLIMAPIFYSAVFRPNEKTVAQRLDSLGFDERIITMQELQGDNSVMADLQRKDAVGVITAADNNAAKTGGALIKFGLSTASLVAACVVGGVSIALTIITGLSGYGLMPSGKAVWGDVFPGSVTSYLVEYDKYGEATLTGDGKQSVKNGGSTSEVLYTAADYYYFTKWVDTYGNVYLDGPSRHEENVTGSFDVKAYFTKVDECEDDEPLGRYFTDGSGGYVGGGAEAPGNGEGLYDYELNKYDYIIDNNTKYTDDYDTYYDAAMKYITDNEDLSAEERAMIETYFNILK